MGIVAMLTAWTVILVALAYVGVLFAIASYGDRAARRTRRGTPRPLTYALSLAVYCTSWAYFGSVGLAASSGYDFLPIYIGPVLMLTVGWPVLRAIVDISKRQNITSIADFISARYGKNQPLGALVAIIAVIGVVPYISLQLKAVSFSLTTLLPPDGEGLRLGQPEPGSDLALIVAIAMAGFAALFGTRHVDATEHQRGLILAIAVESIVKLAAFLAVGIFATFWLMGGIGPLLDRVAAAPAVSQVFGGGLEGGRWVTMTLLAMCAILLLPRQFHVAVVENTNISDLRRAAWLFPLYLVAINLFVVPIAMAGLLTFGSRDIDADTFVLALPAASDNRALTLVAFIGGLSAATAMVIVESVALSIMVCNNLVLPLLVRYFGGREHRFGDIGRHVLLIRRVAIAVVLILAYSYYRMIGASAALTQSGLLSFAAVVQFAPAFFGGLLWRKGTAAGAMAGLLAGFGVWAYTLLMPSFIDAGWLSRGLLDHGLFGLAALRPRMLFHIDFDPLTHGVLWSLLFNIVAYVAVSFLREPSPIERLQASAFVSPDIPAASPAFRLWRTAVSVSELEETVARYLGKERTRRAFDDFAKYRVAPVEAAAEADIRALRFAEHLLASAIGAASSRLVLGLLLERRAGHRRGAISLLDDASDAIQHSRDLLQSAIDHVRQGIAVFDKNLNLICWNQQFRHLLQLPPELGRIGVALDEILCAVALRTGVDEAEVERVMKDRIHTLGKGLEPYQERLANGSVLEVRASRMPDGGIVVTFADMTDRVRAAEELRQVNESLERRVVERTGELVKLNSELARAKADAEAANLGKTRFIAAASHDILQPLNAARLFTSSLVERQSRTGNDQLVHNLDASLEAVEEILSALLDISRLDAGATKPQVSSFQIGELLQALAVEMAPAANDRGVKLAVLPSSLMVRSDRKLLRRIVQNLMSNAVKYAPGQRVVVGCRRRNDAVRIEVHDTGPGIPEDKLRAIFLEFERLRPGDGSVPGLGLGLSIVERIARMLDHQLEVRSTLSRGSMFALTVPQSRSMCHPAAVEAQSRQPVARPGELAGTTVLVVDNEEAILRGMDALLGHWQMPVITATNGAQAIAAAACSPSPVGIVVADYHLEREDGLKVIEKLRAEAGRMIPAILITADRSRAVQDRAAKLGVVHMRKPIRSAALRAALSHLLTRAEAAE
jgi:Na+/proline symporter/CheY-like chemotaxis protein/two-component sensor histidine kinase